MNPRSATIVTNFTLSIPSRLHFGLFSISGTERFGGIGLMIDEPNVVIHCRASNSFSISGLHRDIVSDVVEKLGERNLLDRTPESLPIQIELESCPPRHCGLGSGTQIAFGVTAALLQCCGLGIPSPAEMAQAIGRGKRSAIGSHGFFRGGCIVDSGIGKDQNFAPMENAIEFPTQWPIVLIRPRQKSGLHGQNELSAFDKLRGNESDQRGPLKNLCHEQILPGIQSHNYSQFAQALHTFNRTSGEYFSEFQSGAYNSSQCEQIVSDVLQFGVPAVGQSSWGPTLFAVAPDETVADDLIAYLRDHCAAVGDDSVTEIIKTNANNCGMKIVRHSEAENCGESALTG